MLNNPLGAGNARKHTEAPYWAREYATDYWFNGGTLHTGVSGDGLLTGWGYTLTSLAVTAGSLADFISAADVGTPNIVSCDAAGDVLISPNVFGDYAHALAAGSILGYTPNQLCLEAYACFSVANGATETTTGFGFTTGTALTATNHTAFIYSNGTNFAIKGADGTGGNVDTGALVSTTFHLWKVVMTAGGSVEWFIDNVSQGTITLTPDLFPTGFGMAAKTTSGTNFPQLAWAHIWYR